MSKPKTESAKQKIVAVLFANYGFYHLARLKAISQVAEILAIEFASEQKLYGWHVDKQPFGIMTLYNGAIEAMSYKDLLKSCRGIWYLLSTKRPSNLLIPGYHDLRCLTAAVWAKMHKAQSILMYDSTELDKPRSFLKEACKRLLIKYLFSKAFVGGVRSSQYLQKLGLPSKAITSKYDVIDNAFFSRGVKTLRATQSPDNWKLPERYFLFVGRLAPEKNVEVLLKAYVNYRDSGGDWSLVIVGSGPESRRLMALADKLRLSNVHFAGFKNGEELFPYYAFASCFVLPSISEPWGLVVNEAMASSLPIVLSKFCGCTPDLLQTGLNGYSFDPYEVAELAAIFRKVSSLSRSERATMAEHSSEIIQKFSPTCWASSAMSLMES